MSSGDSFRKSMRKYYNDVNDELADFRSKYGDDALWCGGRSEFSVYSSVGQDSSRDISDAVRSTDIKFGYLLGLYDRIELPGDVSHLALERAPLSDMCPNAKLFATKSEGYAYVPGTDLIDGVPVSKAFAKDSNTSHAGTVHPGHGGSMKIDFEHDHWGDDVWPEDTYEPSPKSRNNRTSVSNNSYHDRPSVSEDVFDANKDFGKIGYKAASSAASAPAKPVAPKTQTNAASAPAKPAAPKAQTAQKNTTRSSVYPLNPAKDPAPADLDDFAPKEVPVSDEEWEEKRKREGR